MKSEQETTNQQLEGHLLFLNPSQIEINDEFNVRPFTKSAGQNEQDVVELGRLVESIEKNGQEQPVIVQQSESTPNSFTLVAGNRRLQAISLINAGREAGNELLVKAVINESDDPFRAAFDENDKRQAMSPMNKALNFKFIRERENLKGAKGDKFVADYFGVNVATVIQYKKLESLASEIQAKVHSGLLTVDAALVVAKAAPEVQEQVIHDAERIEAARVRDAEEEAAVNNVVTGVAGKNKKKGAGKKSATKTRQAKGGKSGVSAASVKKAARAHNVKSARSRKEILEWVAGENGPAYKESVTEFLTYFAKWADGEGTDKTLSVKFAAAVGKKK